MSSEASRARKVGPFVQTVASAIWFAAIEGFFSTASSSSISRRVVQLLVELLELLLGVAADGVA